MVYRERSGATRGVPPAVSSRHAATIMQGSARRGEPLLLAAGGRRVPAGGVVEQANFPLAPALAAYQYRLRALYWKSPRK